MNNEEEIVKLDTKEAEESKDIIQKYLKQDNDDNNKILIVHNDKMLESDIGYIKANNKSFNQLLDAYVKNTKQNLSAKLWFKKIFFATCIIILLAIATLMFFVTVYCLFNDVSKETLIISMINSIVSFAASFIVLPHTIANYLFNTDEEKDMTGLVKNLQDHDVEIRKRISK